MRRFGNRAEDIRIFSIGIVAELRGRLGLVGGRPMAMIQKLYQIGRLVRRKGVPEKELFVLDGRLCRSVRSRMNRLRAVFANYERIKTLTID